MEKHAFELKIYTLFVSKLQVCNKFKHGGRHLYSHKPSLVKPQVFFSHFFLILFIYNLKVQVYVACLNTRFGRIHAQRITKPAFLYSQHMLSFDIIIIIKVLSHQRKDGRSLFTTLWLDDSIPQSVNKILQMLSLKENFIFRNLKNLEWLKDTLPITT